MKAIDNICIIDDDPITIYGIRKMLSLTMEGRTISSYANGKLALDAIGSCLENSGEVPDMIFLDINMPIMDGWRFLDKFIGLTLQQKVHINIVTSSIDPIDRQHFEDCKKKTDHILNYIQKPIRRADIKAILKRASTD